MVKVKVCGLTNPADYRRVSALGVDFTGFVFYPPSPRYVSPRVVRRILGRRKERKARAVGVFVNERPEVVRQVFRYCRLDIVQLHGEESIQYCRELGLPCWKVFRVGPGAGVPPGFWEYPCEAFLLDRFDPGRRGGTGIRIDPDIARRAIDDGRRVILAGGISPANIEEICRLRPYGVDVNSGVESAPGSKDPVLIEALLTRIRKIDVSKET